MHRDGLAADQPPAFVRNLTRDDAAVGAVDAQQGSREHAVVGLGDDGHLAGSYSTRRHDMDARARHAETASPTFPAVDVVVTRSGHVDNACCAEQ
jgi:hypothetical protein